MQTTILSLPVELLIVIANGLSPSDFLSLLLTNALLNTSLTSLLYSNVQLTNAPTTEKLLDTFSHDPANCTFQRDIAALIRVLVIDWQSTSHTDDDEARSSQELMEDNHARVPTIPEPSTMRAQLERAVHRMCNVERFTCLEPSLITADTLVILVAFQSLRALDLNLADIDERPLDITSSPIVDSRPVFPHLSRICLVLPSKLSTGYKQFIAHILDECASHLEHLTLKCSSEDQMDVIQLFSDTREWPKLQELCLPTATDLALLPSAPILRSLDLDLSHAPESDELAHPRVVPPTVFPVLEELSCRHEDLSAFLPVNSDNPRPIRSVRLDGATYGIDGGRYNILCYVESEEPWEGFDLDHLLQEDTFSPLLASAVPVTELSFALDNLDVSRLPSIVPYVQHLESLTIVVGSEPYGHRRESHMLGRKMFKHMPNLHTFLLCGSPTAGFISEWREDWVRWQENCLRLYKKRSAVIRRVMITLGYEWVKAEDGTWSMVEGGEQGRSYIEEESSDSPGLVIDWGFNETTPL